MAQCVIVTMKLYITEVWNFNTFLVFF